MLDDDFLHPVGSLAHWAFLHVLVLRCPSGAASCSQVRERSLPGVTGEREHRNRGFAMVRAFTFR
jgi:hypothetical protein